MRVCPQLRSFCCIDTVVVISYTQCMKSLMVIFLICIQPVMAYAHPGKTDSYGGHRCLKGCEGWGLFYNEYHLHDKDGKPLRVGNNKRAKVPEIPPAAGPESKPTETAVPATGDKPKTEVVTTYRYITNVYEENVFLSNPFLSLLLILLLLLLILGRNRKRE